MSATTRAILDCRHCAPDRHEYCDNHDVPRLASRLDTALAALADLDSLRSERDTAVAEWDEAEQHSLSEYARGVADGSEINVSILAESNVTLEEQRDLINSLRSEHDAAVHERDKAKLDLHCSLSLAAAEEEIRAMTAQRDQAIAARAEVERDAMGWTDQRAAMIAEVGTLRSEHDAAVRDVYLARTALASRGYCGDGNLAKMIERALVESKQLGRDEMHMVSRALNEASDAFPPDWCGTIAERVMRLRSERDAAIRERDEWRKRAGENATEWRDGNETLGEMFSRYSFRAEANIASLTAERDAARCDSELFLAQRDQAIAVRAEVERDVVERIAAWIEEYDNDQLCAAAAIRRGEWKESIDE